MSPKSIHFQPMIDMIIAKLLSWKDALISIAGRTQLVRSVIQGMLIHSFMVYSWHISLLKILEKYTRNFIWSGGPITRKLVSVVWDKVCLPLGE